VYLIDKKILGRLDEDTSLAGLARTSGADGYVSREYDGFFTSVSDPAGRARAEVEFESRRVRGAVFFDRDGTINVDTGYAFRPDDLAFIPGAVAAVKRVNDSGRYAFLVTNQSGIARGYYTESNMHAFHAHMQRHLRAAGAHFDDIRFCPYHPDGTVARYARSSDWRKPAPGMLLDLLSSWPVDRDASFVVGNTQADMRAAEAAGLRGLLFGGGDLDQLLAPVLQD
jgi:D,D-heptose 1,7-bisphosphate phosphatase